MLDIGQLRHQIQAVDKGDDASRRQALHSLRDHEGQDWADAPPEVIHALVESLQRQLLNGTKQPSLRQEVLTILGNMGAHSKRAIPQLIDLLQEGVPDAVREAAVRTLGRIGREARVAVDALINVLSHCRATLAVQAVQALGDLGCADHRVRTALINLWLSPAHSQNSQVEIAIALCKLKIDVSGLLRFVTSTLVANPEVSLRKSAAEALSWCGKDEADVVPALLTAALSDKKEEVRQKAQAGLDRLRLSQDKAIQLCAKQLKDSSYAEVALRKSGLPAVPALIEAVGAEDSATREKAVRILGSLGELAVAAAPALTRALHDKDLDTRLAVAKALWHTTKKAELVVPVLVDLLEDKWAAAQDSSESRRRFVQTVIEALWRIGPPAKAAIPMLIHKTKDKNRLISEAALSALKEIAPTVASRAALR